MGRINSYANVTTIAANDEILVDGADGTRNITVANLSVAMDDNAAAVQHRNIYRGRNIGTSVTAEQLTAIKAGSFKNLFVGDYWTINGHEYTIADMDYWYNKYDKLKSAENTDTEAVNVHHLVMISPTFTSFKMNDTDTTAGAYLGSKMNTEYLADARAQIATDFGDMLVTHREIFSSEVTDGVPSAHVWADSKADLMNEAMVYGHWNLSPSPANIINHDHNTIDWEQLAVFRLSPAFQGRATTWLRDVVSASCFARLTNGGNAGYLIASTTHNARLVFAIGDAS